MARTPFKLRSGNTSSFKNLGSSPVKQDIKQKVTEGFSKNIHNPGKTTIVTTTTPKGSTYVETSNKTGRVLSEGGKSTTSTSTKPKWDPTKRQDVTKWIKDNSGMQKTNVKKAVNLNSRNALNKTLNIDKNLIKKTDLTKRSYDIKVKPSKKSLIKKGAKNFLKKGFKFLGGKTLGVLGMLHATSSKADQPTYESTGNPRYKKDESQQIRDLLTKHGLKGGDYK